MKRTGTYCKTLMVLFISVLFTVALGEGQSSEQKSSATLGSYKTLAISASPEYSAKYQKPAKGDPVAMAYEFFELNKKYFYMKNPHEELILANKVLDETGNVVAFTQLYNGVPIDTRIKVYFTRDGDVREITGKYLYDISLSTTPSIDSASAVRLALQAMGSPPHPKVVGPGKPFIVSSKTFRTIKEDRLYLVWKVEIHPDSTKRLDKFERYYVDASTGAILYHEWSSILRH